MRFWLIIFGAVVCCGCASELQLEEEQSEFKSGVLSSDGAVRIGLAQLHDTLPLTSYEALLEDQSIVETGEISGSVMLGADFRKLLLTTAAYRVDQIGDHVVFVQRFKLNKDFVPLRLFSDAAEGLLPFKMKMGAEIEFARLFSSEFTARAAKTFTLMDLPFDTASALRLPVGTIVTVPIETHLSVDVGGQFLGQASKYGQPLDGPLRLSAFGSASSVRKGTLVGEGSFRLQIIRLDGESVRVRLLSSAQGTVAANFSFSASGMAQYTFLPATKIDQIRAFRRHLNRGKTLIDEIRSLPERVEAFRSNLPEAVKATLDSVPISSVEALRDDITDAADVVDDALAEAQVMLSSVETLDDMIGQHVDMALETTSTHWDGLVEPVLKRVENLSSRLYSATGTVQLSDSVSRRIGLLADYEFDLAQETARIAFDRAISGRAIWLGPRQLITTRRLSDSLFADFTLAETLANDDHGAAQPSVRRLAIGSSDLRERRHSVSVSGLAMKFGFERGTTDNRVSITDHTGRVSRYQNRVWERSTETKFFGEVRSETYASGAFVNSVGQDIIGGGYWIRWKKSFPMLARQPVRDTLTHLVNDLGPTAVSAGVGTLYQGEFFGLVDAELFAVLSSEALESIFDPELATDQMLWSVLGQMMGRYVRPAALPFAIAPIRPNELNDIPGASEACEKLAEKLGGRYCYSFLDRIFPALKRAQIERTSESRLAFFESFYRVPFGGDALSTRVLIRYLTELAWALGVNEPMAFHVKVMNRDNDSMAASPSLSHGDKELLELGSTTALIGISMD